MKTIQFYHNPRCRKSREALAILRDKKVDIQVIEYLKKELTEKEISQIIDILNINPSDLVRKNEKIWKENYKGKNIEENEIVKILVQHPILIERPIAIYDNKAIIGRPPEKVLEIL